MYITHSVMVVLVTVGKPDISSLIGLDTYHHVMVRIEKYINNVEWDHPVTSTGHSTLRNISHIQE